MVVSSGGIPDEAWSTPYRPSKEAPLPQAEVEKSYWIKWALMELEQTLTQKNDDYRVTEGEFSNFYFASDISGVSARDIILAQIGIKIGRIRGLLNGLNTDINFESLEDSIKDLAGYAVILMAHDRSQHG